MRARSVRTRPPTQPVTSCRTSYPLIVPCTGPTRSSLPCTDPLKTKDCRPDPTNGAILQQPYLGPVPIVTHVHGAHVSPNSDGYPEAWWLPRREQHPGDYATTGTLVNEYGTPTNNAPGIGKLQLPEHPAVDHTLVPRPHPGHDPQQRLRGSGRLLADP